MIATYQKLPRTNYAPAPSRKKLQQVLRSRCFHQMRKAARFTGERSTLLRSASYEGQACSTRATDDASDQDVTAYQMAYQWAHGTGRSHRRFNENSTMGRQLMKTEYVLSAVQSAVHDMMLTGKPGAGKGWRSLGAQVGSDWKHVYPFSFALDATLGNHTRALHGSMEVKAEAGKTFQHNGKTYVTVRVTGTDDLSAISGTRRGPSEEGYGGRKKESLFSQNNPFGESGPFRTIKTDYDLQFSVEINQSSEIPGLAPGLWKIDPDKILPGRPPQ